MAIDKDFVQGFEKYVGDVCGIVGMSSVQCQVIKGDYTGEAEKYRDTVYGKLERDAIKWHYENGWEASACASHLWSRFGRIVF